MTAVKTPDWRTASTAATQPTTYSAANTIVSSLLPDPASYANPTAVAVTAITTAAHHGTPGMLGWIERRSAATPEPARCADTGLTVPAIGPKGCKELVKGAGVPWLGPRRSPGHRLGFLWA